MSTPKEVRVVLIDDHAMVHQALASVLGESEDIRVIGQGGDVREALELVEGLAPDVLVLDYNLPGGGALAVIEHVQRKELALRILILTVHENPHYAVRVLEAGALGFLVKSAAVEELVTAIRAVDRGELYVSSQVSGAVLAQLRRPRSDRSGALALSDREFELLRLLAGGLGLSEAAERLSVSVSTASTYRARMLKKLGLKTTGELIRYSLENDLESR
ncbi:MAG: response regulator transcription factor [Planctomycetota bacterium]